MLPVVRRNFTPLEIFQSMAIPSYTRMGTYHVLQHHIKMASNRASNEVRDLLQFQHGSAREHLQDSMH